MLALAVKGNRYQAERAAESRGRVSQCRLLALLEVGPDPVTPSCEKLSWQSDGRAVFNIR